MAKRQLTEAAQAAKIIRNHLKKHGVKASVTTSNYAGGSSIRVTLIDAMPATVQLVKDYVEPFSYKSFDGMTDMESYKNTDFEGAQAGYIFVDTDWSDELINDAKVYGEQWWDDHAGWYEGNVNHDRNYFYNAILSGREGNFWATRKPRVTAEV